MSLETLLEAAEFLESRGQGTDGDKKLRQSIERQFSEPGTSVDGSDNGFHFVKGRTRTKSGSSRSDTPVSQGGSDNFFLRAGTREVHNKLEKNRRAHLKECFDFLKKNIPSLEDRRTSNLGILRSSLRYIQNLKRKEREFELEMQKFAHEKIVLQERMNSLKGELNKMNIDVDINAFVYLPESDNDSNSTSTATERGTPPPSDHDEHDDDEEEAENLAMESNSPVPKSPRKRKISGRKDIPNMIHTDSFPKLALHSSVNGIITKSSSAPTFSVPKPSPKKVIPITLSLSGPVPSPSLSVINNINPGPAAFEMSVTGKILEIPPVRTPVTQILHRTLQQRQQALLSQKMAASSTTVSKVASAPLTAAQLKSPPLSQPLPVVTMATTQVAAQPSMVVKDGLVSSTKLITSTVGTSASKLVSSASGVPTMSIPYYMASLQKIAHPVLVTSLMAPAVGLQTASATVPATSIIPTIASGPPALPVKTVSKPETITSLTVANSNVRTLNNLPTVTLVSTAKSEALTTTSVASSLQSASIPIRPIFAPNILPGQQIAWPFVTIPKSNVLVTSTPVPSQAATVVATTTTSQVTSHPLVSLAQLNQLTQMMTPMTVMSPGIQMTPSALTQAQLNSMFTSPLLKQFPLGIPSSLLQSGQVLGQQVLKPVVVVTVPNVMSQSSATLPSNTSLVTSSL